MLRYDSTIMTNFKLKLYLFNQGIKEKRCECCKLTHWLDVLIPLELHHLDGNNTNNELCNLQILCPNCHALTTYYRGANKKRRTKTIISDDDFIQIINTSYSRRQALLTAKLTAYGGNYNRINSLINSGKAKLLPSKLNPKIVRRIEDIKNLHNELEQKSAPYVKPKKIDWPDRNRLFELITTLPATKISMLLGVSDSAIRKKAKSYGFNILEISPWAKRHNPNKKVGMVGVEPTMFTTRV